MSLKECALFLGLVSIAGADFFSPEAVLAGEPGRVDARSVLIVSSVTQGATVEIDGAEVGRVPIEPLVLLPGVHRIKLSKSGYMPFEQEFQVAAGKTIELEIDLLPRPYPTEREGFFARFALGLGYLGASYDASATDRTRTGNFVVDVDGFAFGFSSGLGAMVFPNVGINVDLFGGIAASPSAEINGQAVEVDSSRSTLVALGAGATYYFMPINLYVALSLGAGWTSVDDESLDSGKAGFAMNAMIGKEWWVHPDWSLGISAQLLWADIPEKESIVDGVTVDTSGSVFGVNIMFSTSFN